MGGEDEAEAEAEGKGEDNLTISGTRRECNEIDCYSLQRSGVGLYQCRGQLFMNLGQRWTQR